MASNDPSAMRALAYYRVSTDEQGQDGYGMGAQRSAVEAFAARKGWTLVESYEDVASGKTLARRPGLKDAMERMEDRGQNGSRPEVLVVAKLDRLARSTLDFARILERSAERDWKLAIVDLDMDLTTPYGKFTSTIIMAIAEVERALIGERTKAALRIAKQRGAPIGRPRAATPELLEELWRLRGSGLSLRKTADALNDSGVLGPQGGRWTGRSVQLFERRYGVQPD